MISFILSAVVLVLIAIVFITPALLKKNHSFSDEYDDLNVEIAKDRLKEIKNQLEAGEIDKQTYQQLHDELEATLAQDLSNAPQQKKQTVKEKNRLIPALLAICLPVVSAAIYFELGDFEAATGTRVAATVIPAGENRPQMTIEDAVAKLEQRLVEQPENADGWFMLAKTYMTMKQYQKATVAYEKVINLVGEEPEVLLRYADAVAMTEGGNLIGKAKPVVDKLISLMPDNPTVLWMAGSAEVQLKNFGKALSYWYKLQPMLASDASSKAQLDELINNAESQLDGNDIAAIKRSVSVASIATTQKSKMPDNLTVLWMAGSAEMQKKNFGKALSYWYKLQPMLANDVSAQTQLDELINNAESQLDGNDIAAIKRAVAVEPATSAEKPGNATSAKAEIIVSVELDPSLKDRVSANDTLFIFAKATQGPPMPLAAVKKTVSALPLTVSLNDAMAMMPNMKLSNFEQVKISAVISRSGQPGTQAGDLYVEISPVNVKAQEKIHLIINQVK